MADELKWHYGPTDADPDPGKRWHYECGGEVWYIDDGDICRKCGEQDAPANPQTIDRILPWSEVREGDQALLGGVLVAINKTEPYQETGLLGTKYDRLRVSYRNHAGGVTVTMRSLDELAAVRRPAEAGEAAGDG